MKKFSNQANQTWEGLRQILLAPGSGQSSSKGQAQSKPGNQAAGNAQPDNQAEPQSAQYAVFDQNGQALGTHFDINDAIQQWKDQTDKMGQIIDLENQEDITPDPNLVEKVLESLGLRQERSHLVNPKKDSPKTSTPPMDRKQLRQVQKLAGKGVGNNPITRWLGLDDDLLPKYIASINKLDLPVFQVAKKRREKSATMVAVRKRRMKVNRKTITVTEEQKSTISHKSMQPSNILADDIEIGRMREVSDLSQVVRRSQFGLPEEILARKIANRELPVRRFLVEEDDPEEVTKAIKKEVIVDEPVVEEYVDMQPVDENPQGQLLYILADASGSTIGATAVLEAALAVAVIGRNKDNSSRYFWQPYAYEPGRLFSGETPSEKEQLIRDIPKHSSSDGGTSLYSALSEASNRIRAEASPDDQPEIMVITDGNDDITADDIYYLLRDDIILHAVVVNGSNVSLKAHASTYVELYGDGSGNVIVNQG